MIMNMIKLIDNFQVHAKLHYLENFIHNFFFSFIRRFVICKEKYHFFFTAHVFFSFNEKCIESEKLPKFTHTHIFALIFSHKIKYIKKFVTSILSPRSKIFQLILIKTIYSFIFFIVNFVNNIEESKSSTLNMVRENGEAAQDGADEKMLGSDDKETLALKNIEVKFISGDQNANGDAKIDIGYDSSKVSSQIY
jgi:hypothetical protein